MAFEHSPITDVFACVDESGFVDYAEAEQPWRNMNVTFLCDAERGENAIGFDPYDDQLNALLQPQKIKLICEPKCWDMGTGGMGGH